MMHFRFRNISILILAVVSVLVSVASMAGVQGSKHDFTSPIASPNAFFYGTGQVCVFCHTAHNADPASGALWNHEVDTGQSYIMYSSSTMDMSQSTNPHSGSLICLSCHDGTIAVNSLNNMPGPEQAGTYGSPGGSGLDGTGKLTSASHAFVGTDLTDDHPVGITYDSNLDVDFHPKTGVPTNYPDRLLDSGLYVECISCHNPHSNIYSNFLVESNTNSALCMRCHIK